MEIDVNHFLFALIAAGPETSDLAVLIAKVCAKWLVALSPLVVGLVWLAGGPDDRRAAVAAPLVAGIGLSAAFLTEFLYFHPRPFAEGLARNVLHHAANSSFPSDHAVGSFALAFGLLFCGGALARRAGVALLFVAATVSWGRVRLGVHFPLDIAGGALYALCATMALDLRPVAALLNFATGVGEAVRARLIPARFARQSSAS